MNQRTGMRKPQISGFALFTDDPSGKDLEHCLQPSYKVWYFYFEHLITLVLCDEKTVLIDQMFSSGADLWRYLQVGTGFERTSSRKIWRNTDCPLDLQKQVRLWVCPKFVNERFFVFTANWLNFAFRLCFRAQAKGETERERLLLAYQVNEEVQQGHFPVSKELGLEVAALMAQVGVESVSRQGYRFLDSNEPQWNVSCRLSTVI